MPYSIPADAQPIHHSYDEDGTWLQPNGMLVMLNEGGHNRCSIDVPELLVWLREHRPDLLVGCGLRLP